MHINALGSSSLCRSMIAKSLLNNSIYLLILDYTSNISLISSDAHYNYHNDFSYLMIKSSHKILYLDISSSINNSSKIAFIIDLNLIFTLTIILYANSVYAYC